MKFDELYLNFTKDRFLNSMETRWSDLFEEVYSHFKRNQQKRRLETLLNQLIEQREKINNLIYTVEFLLDEYKDSHKDEYKDSHKDEYTSSLRDEYTSSLKDEYASSLRDEYASSLRDEYASCLKGIYKGSLKKYQRTTINNFSKTYMNLINEIFDYASFDISSFIYDIALTSEETKVDIAPSDIYTLISYKISSSIKENFELNTKKMPLNLEKKSNKYFIYFSEGESLYKSTFLYDIIQKYATIYDSLFDKAQVNLDLLFPQKTDNQDSCTNEYRSQIYSQLFRTILSKYIYTWRSKNNITQNELAQKSGVDRTMIAKIERLQQTASLDTTIKLLDSINAYLMIIPKG